MQFCRHVHAFFAQIFIYAQFMCAFQHFYQEVIISAACTSPFGSEIVEMVILMVLLFFFLKVKKVDFVLDSKNFVKFPLNHFSSNFPAVHIKNLILPVNTAKKNHHKTNFIISQFIRIRHHNITIFLQITWSSQTVCRFFCWLMHKHRQQQTIIIHINYKIYACQNRAR